MLSIIVPINKYSEGNTRIHQWISNYDAEGIEIILVHDKNPVSYFDTKNYLEGLKILNPDIKIEIVEGVFRNPGSARNAGLTEASGEWITFWDSDDMPDISQVARCVKEVTGEVNVIVGGFRVRDLAETSNIRVFRSTNLIDLAVNPGLWRICFKRVVIKHPFPPLRMAEDQIFLAQNLCSTASITFSDRIFYDYYKGHYSQLTSQPDAMTDLRNSLIIVGEMLTANSECNSTFMSIIYIRLLLSCIKKSKVNRRFALFTLLKYSTQHPYLTWIAIEKIRLTRVGGIN
jgi:glycosyltransferase involved in cell wall biosynthesis